MSANKQIATKPGVVVKEYIKSKGLTQAEFANVMGISLGRLENIISGQARINANTAIKLAWAANDSARDAQYWMGVQSSYELSLAEQGVAA